MKKIISLMLVVVLCLSVFAACGTSAAVPSATAQASESAAPSETTEASESATADVNAAELKTLTLFHHMGEEAKKSALQGVVDSFAANQAGLAIDAQFIDFGNYKNCVGTFHPAQKIHVSVPVLASLSEAEYRSGLAEVFKTALLYAPKLFQILAERKDEVMARDQVLLAEIVKRCVQAKARVVERDLRETGERMFLNLGHTFGHALESVAGFGNITHGEAVAWGIARALELGRRLGITDTEYIADVIPVLESYGWSSSPVHPVIAARIAEGKTTAADNANAIFMAMKNDKKKKAGNIRFILQREINSTLVSEVDDADVLAVLA